MKKLLLVAIFALVAVSSHLIAMPPVCRSRPCASYDGCTDASGQYGCYDVNFPYACKCYAPGMIPG